MKQEIVDKEKDVMSVDGPINFLSLLVHSLFETEETFDWISRFVEAAEKEVIKSDPCLGFI